MLQRAFTVAEANALIPALEDALNQIELCMTAVQKVAERLQVLDVLWGAKLLDPGNPDHAQALSFRQSISRLMTEVEEIVAKQILARGLRFPQGGLEHGLIDFPTTWEGRWVFLCWRKGESKVGWWHETDEGFAGRNELTPEQVTGMGRGDPFAGDPDEPWRT